MEYNKTFKSYIDYVNKCRNLIINAFFSEKDIDNIDFTDDEIGINEIIKNHRLKMIDIKLNHTLRMIEQIIKINETLGFKIDLGLVVKVATLYHDIGRISQATWSNTFSDNIYKKKNKQFNNHGEEGYDIFLMNDFNVDEKYIPIIGEAILHHQDVHTQPRLNAKLNDDLSNIKIDKIVTGDFDLNEAEWQIASLIVQLVADVDKADILYQHLSSDFKMIKDYIYDYSYETLDNISKKWGVSKEEIIIYNQIDSLNYQPQRLKIPIANMPLEKLEVPKYMKDMFYNNSWPELKELSQSNNWNFITILWWRLSHFLNQITFTSTLINLEESKLLEQIYEKIPTRLKPLVYEAFEYAKEVLVLEKIDKNKNSIYLTK